MSTHKFGHIEFERDPSKLDPALDPQRLQGENRVPVDVTPPESGENRETGGYGREHYNEIEQDRGERGPQSAPDGRQTDEVPEFERKQQPVTGHQDRRHK